MRSQWEAAENRAIMAILWEMSVATGSALQRYHSTHLSANSSNHASFGDHPCPTFSHTEPLLNAMLIYPRVLSISGQVTSRSRSVSLCQKSFGVIIPQWGPEDLHRRMKGSRERRKQLWPSQEPLKYDSLTQQEALQAPEHYAPSQPESGSNSTGVSGNEDSLVQFHLDSPGYKLC